MVGRQNVKRSSTCNGSAGGQDARILVSIFNHQITTIFVYYNLSPSLIGIIFYHSQVTDRKWEAKRRRRRKKTYLNMISMF